jgi:protein TonB
MAMVREKNSEVDLKRKYPKVFRRSLGISLLVNALIAVLFPALDVRSSAIRPDQVLIVMEPIPEIRQIQRPPPPPRPAVPVETESEDVPDDVTIASTELDFDQALINLSPPPFVREDIPAAEEEETVPFWRVERPPKPVKRVMPEYPEVAQDAGIEGVVFVRFTVGTDGRVKDAQVLRGPEIFRESALNAVFRFVFKPALQNDKPVAVRMTMPIRFRLQGGRR